LILAARTAIEHAARRAERHRSGGGR
jgi:hypothetical protein